MTPAATKLIATITFVSFLLPPFDTSSYNSLEGRPLEASVMRKYDKCHKKILFKKKQETLHNKT